MGRWRREKRVVDTGNLPQTLELARSLATAETYLEALDVYEALVRAYPQYSVSLLAEVYNLYQNIPNKDVRYTLYQARHFTFDIKPGEKVLDIGSGHLPFPLATHLSDISFTDHHYGRAGEPFRYVDGKPVYECDIENLPFGDKEFDFVYCSHVLEHVKNPERACAELMRVGKRGYIETPTRGKDAFLNTAKISNHIWSVEYTHDTLIFTEYEERERGGLDTDILMQMHCDPKTDREKAFSAALILQSDIVNTMVMWEGEFSFLVRRLGTREQYVSGSTASNACR